MNNINKAVLCVLLSGLFLSNIAAADDSPDPNFTDFLHALERGSDQQAAQMGRGLFECLDRKYRADAGFSALKSKMAAADFLASQMITQLKTAAGRQMFVEAANVFGNVDHTGDKRPFNIVPAKSIYDSSLEVFSKPISIGRLGDDEKEFLRRFYNLKLRLLTSSIAQTGQSLAIAEPTFAGTYDYVLILPLLHTSENEPVNMDVLPTWMRRTSQLVALSDSALLHYGLVYQAQAFARQAAHVDQSEFSQEQCYRAMAKRCAQQLPHVAVDCLTQAMEFIEEQEVDERISLQFDMTQIWLDSENFSLAAGQVKRIADSFTNHQRRPHAVWLYFYALSRANNVETILADVDTALSDLSCSDYKAKLLYLKWWALRRQRSQTAQIAALEHKLTAEYSTDEMIAPVMLSRATDMLARQDYSEALALLAQIQQNFPRTKASQQAEKMTTRLKAIQGS